MSVRLLVWLPAQIPARAALDARLDARLDADVFASRTLYELQHDSGCGRTKIHLDCRILDTPARAHKRQAAKDQADYRLTPG